MHSRRWPVTSVDDLVRLGGSRVVEHANIGERTTYRVGGSARVLVTLSCDADVTELAPLVRETGLHVIALGNGSNTLIADGEHDLVVVQVGGELATMTWCDDGESVLVTAGAGLGLPVAARRLASAGVVDFEWAVGVPGTFGGALAMNAGGHGSDIHACVESARVWRGGGVSEWSREQLALGYRSSALVDGDVVVAVTLRLTRGSPVEANERVRGIVRWRRENQPGGTNAGSVFRNPENDHAARLIEAAGLKGLRVGGAHVSEKHANFVQADPGTRARDVFDLITVVGARVRDYSGVTLLVENRFVGFEGAS